MRITDDQVLHDDALDEPIVATFRTMRYQKALVMSVARKHAEKHGLPAPTFSGLCNQALNEWMHNHAV